MFGLFVCSSPQVVGERESGGGEWAKVNLREEEEGGTGEEEEEQERSRRSRRKWGEEEEGDASTHTTVFNLLTTPHNFGQKDEVKLL